MAIKVTRKELENTFVNIYCVGYCELEYTLRYAKRLFYNYGYYGWNYDVYMVDADTVILTGYRGTFGKRIPVELAEKTEKKAQTICHDFHTASQREKITRLLNNMCKQLKKEGV